MPPAIGDGTELVRILFIVLALAIAFLSVGGAFITTDIGQFLALPRSWVVTYGKYNVEIAIVTLVLLAIFILLNNKYGFWRRRYIVLSVVGVAVGLFVAQFMNLLIFPSNQYSAEYTDVSEAPEILDDTDTVYAVEVNGDAVAFPRKFMLIPHVAGASIGGEEVVMTYCGLSNLPMAFAQQNNGEKMHLTAFAQTNNNLILRDKVSGELIQQISATTESGSTLSEQYANQMMSWGAFQDLYPNGRVFVYEGDRLMDRLLLAAFGSGLRKHFDPEQGPMFPTLRLDDDRLPLKEEVWGLNVGGEAIAFARSFFEDTSVQEFSLAGLTYVAVYDRQHDTVSFYDGDHPGFELPIRVIDPYGMTQSGQLQRVPSHNGVLWMVWSHYFPKTSVRK